MRTKVLIMIVIIASVGLYNTPACGGNLVLPTGGRVAVELVTSYADYHNTLSLVSPNAAIVLSGCQVEAINALPLELLSEKTSQHGCRVELDADPVAAGVQPFAANDTLEFNLCAQSDANPAMCENYWSSDPDSNSDHQDHVKTTELYPGDPNVGGRVFVVTWEDYNNLGDQDFNDLIAVVRVVQDIDEDGLWDDWESKGIDTNGDGSPDYTLPDGGPIPGIRIFILKSTSWTAVLPAATVWQGIPIVTGPRRLRSLKPDRFLPLPMLQIPTGLTVLHFTRT